MNQDRNVRVRTVNAYRIVMALRGAGYHAHWGGPGSAAPFRFRGSAILNHIGVKLDPMAWGNIRTNASGNAAHKIIVRELFPNKAPMKEDAIREDKYYVGDTVYFLPYPQHGNHGVNYGRGPFTVKTVKELPHDVTFGVGHTQFLTFTSEHPYGEWSGWWFAPINRKTDWQNGRNAAKDLLTYLSVPVWAFSVATTLIEGSWSLVVRVDPSYRTPIDIPSTFHGYPVVRQWRRVLRAVHNEIYSDGPKPNLLTQDERDTLEKNGWSYDEDLGWHKFV
jgi:hypothetical protein